jgi:hypothetical protein
MQKHVGMLACSVELSRAEQGGSFVVRLQARSKGHVQAGRQTDEQTAVRGAANPQQEPCLARLGTVRVPMLVGMATPR